ncbi:hypothetical protein [Cryobacterium tagatosivorans]|uniref:Uncharacterized protein n=1 Tax=Cryobacterium tagatosivorans TaxID=1259199 RepID=A0A4V3I608_9MICO|nr:hypothetical protein [Cryobacterium tagatosivorans]TFB46289.1 hypothetical protein E3O23_17690 [Cryobacterium tagatosivorans]
MNLHERGRKLSRAVTGAIGLIAVVAASALGLHTWADVQATKAASQNSASSTLVTPGSDDGGSEDEGSEDEGDEGRDDDSSSSSSSSSSANNAPGLLVRPGNGGPSHASTNGS